MRLRNHISLLAISLILFFIEKEAKAQKPVDSLVVIVPVKSLKMTEYPNGIFRMMPEAFGITQSVKDLPTTVENAKEKSEAYLTKQKLAEIKKQQMRDKGLTEEQIQTDEINRQNAKVLKKVLPDAGVGQRPFLDPLVNLNSANRIPTLQMPTPSLTFDGASQTDNAALGIGAVLPPDVNGDVGLNHYVSSVNLVYKIFNKNGTVAVGPFKTNDLFSGLPAGDPCRVLNSGDPIVVYDPLADRWHISQFAVTGSTNCQCIAVSQTGDPTGAYYVWRYNYPNFLLNDYPKVGVWPDAYHMTFNQFNNAGTTYFGMGILSQDRPKALVGDPLTSVVYTNIATIDPGAGGGLPADIDGIVAPPPGMAEVIAEYRSTTYGDPIDGIRYYKWVPNFITPASSSISVLPDVAIASFDVRNPPGRGDIEQLGGANLDGIADRLMHRFAYRNLGTQAAPINSFVGNFTVNVSGVNPTSAANYQAGIRWFEMRRTADVFSVFDQGTHHLTPGNGASGLNNWMGSIAQDNKGNLALGFSQSGTGQRADIKIAGRTGGIVPAGILNDGEALFHAAAGSQTSSSNRWGDYSAMSVDPIDECTFWYTQEYYAETSTAGWKTRVGKFILPTCTPAPKATIQGTITICATGLPVSGASVNATGGFNRISSASGTYSMTVAPGTYTVSANKAGGFISSTTPTVTVIDGQTLTVDLCLNGFPLLTPATITLISESCLPANGVIDPGETVTIAFGVQNTGGANTVNDVGTLQATGGVTNPGGPQNYGAIVASGPAVSRQFTFTAAPGLFCGTNITATIAHMDGANNIGNVIYSLPTGNIGGAPTTISYSGPPVAIPDGFAAGVNIILPVSGLTGAISDLNFRLDALSGCDATAANVNASVDHTFLGDLVFKLTSPGGTTVDLITRRGGGGNNFCTVLLDDDGAFPSVSTIPTLGGVTGNFSPESPLSAFDGQNPNGNWTLNVSDNATIDNGSLRRFSLIITGSTCCVTPSSCNISSAVFSNAGTCNNNGTVGNATDDYFTADVTVSFVNAPATGFLQFEPGNDAIAGGGALSVSVVGLTSPYTFTGVRFKADGTPTVIEIEFSAEPTTCVRTVVGPTVNSCSSCNISSAVFSNAGPCNDNGTSGNVSDDFFTADITVSFVNAPATGFLQFEPGNDAIAGGGALSVSVVGLTSPYTFTGVRFKADGTPTVVEMEFSAEPTTCVRTVVGPSVNSCSVICSITCPANISVNNTTGQCGAIVNYPAPATSGTCGTVTATPASGSFFPVGLTIVNVSTTAGPSCSFTITVNDNQPPSITCPANISANNTPGLCSAVVNYTAPLGTDNCPGVTTIQIAGLASGSAFPVGVTTNTFRATDAAGNMTTCSFTVTITDNQPPSITCPANISANNTPGLCSAVVNYTAPVGTDNCPGATTTQIAGLASGSAFPVGVTTNTFRATDGAGLTATCSFTVTINDTELPTITCPAAVVRNTDPAACTATFAPVNPTAADNCGVTVQTWAITGATTANSAATGINTVGSRAFNIGVSTITYTVRDAAGNSRTCTQTITINDGQLPVINTQPVNRTLCAGGTTTFSVAAVTAPTAGGPLSYQWQIWNGTAWVAVTGATGATTNTMTLSNVTHSMNTNSYRVQVIGLCTTVSSNFATLFVNPLPTITLTTSIPPALIPTQVLTITATPSSAGGSYVWSKNGVVIGGATSSILNNLTVNDLGTYSVVYTDANGCVVTSSNIVITALPSNNLYVYPIPNRGVFNVRFYNQTNEEATIRVFDMKGSEVYQRKMSTTQPYTTMIVDLTTGRILTSGPYVVEVRGAAGRLIGTRKIIVNK